jgi:hypothetical protein
MRSSTVLSLPPLLVFPDCSYQAFCKPELLHQSTTRLATTTMQAKRNCFENAGSLSAMPFQGK